MSKKVYKAIRTIEFYFSTEGDTDVDISVGLEKALCEIAENEPDAMYDLVTKEEYKEIKSLDELEGEWEHTTIPNGEFYSCLTIKEILENNNE